MVNYVRVCVLLGLFLAFNDFNNVTLYCFNIYCDYCTCWNRLHKYNKCMDMKRSSLFTSHPEILNLSYWQTP
jgi:hypothetical protein